MKTLYDLLGVDKNATLAQIEQGYKKRLDRYLDRQGVGKPDAETRRMQNIRDAYLLLCSPQKRAAYDQQLYLVHKARTHVLTRNNLKRAVLLTLIALAIGAGVYTHRLMLAQAQARGTMHAESLAVPAQPSDTVGGLGAAPAGAQQELARNN